MTLPSAEPLDPAETTGASKRADRALTLWTAGLLLAAVLPEYLVATVALNMRDEFGFANAELAAAIAVCFAGMAVMSPLVGVVVRRVGVRRALVLSSTLVSTSSLGISLFASSAGAVIALMALIGLGGGIGSPTFSAMLAGSIRADRQGTAFGILTAAPQTAAFVAGLALPLVAAPFGWRTTFVLPAAISVTCLVALWCGGRMNVAPRRAGRHGSRRRGLRPIHAIAVAAALVSGAGVGMRSFMVLFAVSAGVDRAVGGLLLSATGLLAIVSRLGFGVLGDRRRGDSLARAAALMLVCSVGYVLMALGEVAPVVAGALLAGGVGWGWQAPLSLAVIAHHPRDTGRAVGIQMSGFYVGALVGPLLIAFAVSHAGYSATWSLCGLLAFAAGSLVLSIRGWAARDAGLRSQRA